MKIVFTGGGTGGHFYPIIAIIESIKKICKEKKIITPKMYFMSVSPYSQGLLYDHDVEFKKVTAGKIRRYFSIKNFFDLFKTLWGSISTFFDLFDIFPDVVFGKGGYASFPVLLAARILRIPVFIHESDSTPGLVNKWAGRFAKRIAVSYKQATAFFPENRTAYTGQPILAERLTPLSEGVFEFFDFHESIPTIFIMGGSQGSETLNNIVMDSLPELVKNFQIIHQTGENNIGVIKESADAILLDSPNKKNYKPFGYLNSLEISMASGCASLVVSRAGSTIFEIASWGKPAIIVPIPEKTSHDQTKNAYAYASTGAASVIEEDNLKPNIFLSEIHRILENKDLYQKMSVAAKAFFKPDAADLIGKELLSIALGHENLG